MRRKVLATALCVAIIAITMGFVAVAKTADASMKPRGNFRAFATSTDNNATKSEADEKEPDGDVAEEVTDNVTDGMDVQDGELLAEPEIRVAYGATPSETTYVSTEDELRNALQKSGKIILDGDIHVTGSEAMWVPGGIKVTIEGATHHIDSGENTNLSELMWIDKNAEVTLQNITIDATGMDYPERGADGRYTDYYAILTKEGSSLTIDDGTNIICYDLPQSIKNEIKGGIWLNGKAVMNGGEISGFNAGGISVGKNGDLTLVDGTISGISVKLKDPDEGGGAINNGGTTTIEGGMLSDNIIGVFNSGNLTMTGGEVRGNYKGIINNNKDGTTGEQFSPNAEVSNVTISGNKIYGIENREGGTLIIKNGTNITDPVHSSAMSLFSNAKKDASQSILICNKTRAKLKVEDSNLELNAPNGIALYNDSTASAELKNTVISVKGANSTGIQNDNPQSNAVLTQGVSMKMIGEGSKPTEGNGNTSVADMEVEAGNRSIIKTIFDNSKGSINPPIALGNQGSTVPFIIKGNPGYRISDVKVNGTSIGAVSQYTLTVTGNDVLEAQFVQVSSSGGSGGSSGGGSGRIITNNTSTKPAIPETPGSWLQDQTGWKFNAPNQTPYTNTWIRHNSQWYWIGTDGYMKTGWNQIAEKWYYLTPATGEMKTSWLQDGDTWYYLDETGAMKTGWVQVGTKWYYLNQDGKMAADTTTPDGYKVDGSGAWVK